MRLAQVGWRAAAILLAAAPAFSAVLTYSNTLTTANNYNASYSAIRSLWEGAITGLETVTFEETGVPTGFVNGSVLLFDVNTSLYATASDCSSASSSQACFNRYTGGNSRWVTNGEPPVPNGNNFFRGLAGGSNYIQVNLPAAMTAFAFDLWTIYSGGQTLTITAYASDNSILGQWFSVPTNNNSTPAFFGVTSDTAIAYVRVQSGSAEPVLARADFGLLMQGGGGPVPETGTLSYLMIGVLAIALGTSSRGRRRRR